MFCTILNYFVISTICFIIASYINFRFLTLSCKERKPEITISWSEDAGLVFCPFTVNSRPVKIKINVQQIYIVVPDFIMLCNGCKTQCYHTSNTIYTEVHARGSFFRVLLNTCTILFFIRLAVGMTIGSVLNEMSCLNDPSTLSGHKHSAYFIPKISLM